MPPGLTRADGIGIVLSFPVRAGRRYSIFYDNAPLTWPVWSNATPQPIYAPTNGVQQWTDDGSTTAPHPSLVTNRFYRINVAWP